MTGRSRHGLHAVRDGDGPPSARITSPLADPGESASVSLHLQSVVLAIAGSLNADTAGRLRMFLSMFTVDGGPRELVLDLSGVFAVDEEGMAPIVEADEVMQLRTASVRLTSVSAAVDRFLDGGRWDRMLATDGPPDTADRREVPPDDDEGPGRDRD